MVESGRVLGKGRIPASIENCPDEYLKRFEYVEYRKIVESGRVSRKNRIPTSIENVSRRVPEKVRICVSTEKWYNMGEYREKTEKWWNPGEYREKVESLRVSKTVPTSTGKGSNLCEYRKIVQFERVPRKNRIPPSIEKLSRRVPENGRICVSTEKW